MSSASAWKASTAAHKASVLSFVHDGYRTEEVGVALNREGIAVRSGALLRAANHRSHGATVTGVLENPG